MLWQTCKTDQNTSTDSDDYSFAIANNLQSAGKSRKSRQKQREKILCDLGTRFLKAAETFPAAKAKPFLVICLLKTEKCISLKLSLKGSSVHVKNIMELHSSVITFEISGCEIFSGPSRNRPQILFRMKNSFNLTYIRPSFRAWRWFSFCKVDVATSAKIWKRARYRSFWTSTTHWAKVFNFDAYTRREPNWIYSVVN